MSGAYARAAALRLSFSPDCPKGTTVLRMMIAACLCLVSLPLASCATAPTSYPKARRAVERADAAYVRIVNRASVVLPRLPAPVAMRVTTGLAVADMALALARAATDPGERNAALDRAAAAAADVVAALSER